MRPDFMELTAGWDAMDFEELTGCLMQVAAWWRETGPLEHDELVTVRKMVAAQARMMGKHAG